MVDKLVLDQVKEQEKWKGTVKDINYKNIVKIRNMKKKIKDQNKSNKRLCKINYNLKDYIQIIKVEYEDWKNWHEQILNQIKELN